MIVTCTGQPQYKIQFSGLIFSQLWSILQMIINPKQGLITSLLKVFSMFELCLIDYRNKL